MWLMRGFEFDTFVDLSRQFNLNRQGGLLARQWTASTRPATAKVRLINAPKIAKAATSSRFIDAGSLRIFARRPFATAARAPEKPAVQTPPPVPRRTLSLKLAATVVPMSREQVEEPKKATTGTLKLKTKVDLPPPVAISRGSTTSDLASAFRAEMKTLTEKAATPAEAAPEPKRRGTLRKGWAELLAQAEEPPARLRDFDLRAAFKAEMKALLARQEIEAPEQRPQQPAADTGNVVPFPSKYDRFSTATKRRILGFNRVGGI